jgi:hypothetical protein
VRQILRARVANMSSLAGPATAGMPQTAFASSLPGLPQVAASLGRLIGRRCAGWWLSNSCGATGSEPIFRRRNDLRNE